MDTFKKKDLILRLVRMTDADLLLNWRNDSKTLEASINMAKIKKRDHLAWLNKVFNDSNTKLFIAEINGTAVGTVRSEFHQNEYELSWTIAPNARGKGFGKKIVSKLANSIWRPLKAKIKKENTASIHIAENAGMTLHKKEQDLLVYKRAAVECLNIRADATTAMGTGHVMRCIALGQAFRDKGGIVNFITLDANSALKSRIKNEQFNLFNISVPNSILDSTKDKNALQQTLEILSNQPPKSWLVLDGYHFGPDFQKSIKSRGFKLLVIDDYNHHPNYHTDLLLNQNIGAEKFSYKTDPKTIKLIGLKYAMLRSEFLSLSQIPIPSEKIKNVLLTMGGSDPANITAKFISIFKKIKTKGILVKLLIGPANPKRSKILPLINSENNIEVIENANMPELMKWSDIAITSAGSTCMELCHMGVPFISVVIAENQKALAINFEKTGVSINLGWFSKTNTEKAVKTIDSLLKDDNKRKKLASRARALVDGKGTIRIIEQMERINSYDT